MMGQWRRLAVVLALVAGLGFGEVEAVATDWNPSSPNTLGLQAFFTQQGEQQLPGAVTFTSTAAQTIDTLNVPLTTTGDATVMAEVYVAGDEIPTGTVRTTTYRPNDDLQIGGNDSENNSWLTQALGTTNLYQQIDESTLDPSDYIFYFGTQNPGKRYRFNVGSAAWGASRRVLGGEVVIVANRQDSAGQLRVSYYDGTRAYTLGTITATKERRTFRIRWPEYNPATGLPWTQAQIAALDSTAGIQLQPVNVNKRKPLIVYQAYLNLDWITENRVAVGMADVEPPAADATFTLQHPTSGADNWSKSNGIDYTVVLRRLRGFGVVGWRFLAQTSAVADELGYPSAATNIPVESPAVTIDREGVVAGVTDGVPGRALALRMLTTGATGSVDGQPYSLFLNARPVSGTGYGQTVTTVGADDYEMVRLLIGTGELGDGGQPVALADPSSLADVSIKVKNASTDVQVGSTYTLTAADVADLAQQPLSVDVDGMSAPTVAVVEVPLTGISLSAATRYYVEVTTTQASPTSPGDPFWSFPYPSASAAPTSGPYGVATFGGATEYVVVTNGTTITTAVDQADFSLTISTEVDPPTNLTATVVDTDTDVSDLDGAGCTIPETETVDLAWTPSALGADFGRYEIDRSNDGGGAWAQIRYGDDEAADATTDLEAPFGTEASYRMRSVRTGDWVPSAWTATATATVQPQNGEVAFASNWLEDVMAVNRDTLYEWPFPDNDGVLQLAGRDYQIVLQEAEDRGTGDEGFTFEVSVYTPGPQDPAQTTPAGVAVFDPLRDFLRTYTPYLAVKDWNGSVFYGRATLQNAETTYGTDGAAYSTAQIRVIQTQAEPTPAPIDTGS